MESVKWILTDDAEFQHCCEIELFRYRFLAVYEPLLDGDKYLAVGDTIDLIDYVADFKKYVSAYYDSLDEVYKTYGESANQIIAECIFEQKAAYDMEWTAEFNTEKEAKRFCRKKMKEPPERWV